MVEVQLTRLPLFKGGKGDLYHLTCPELSLHKVNYNETTKRKKNKGHRISELG
ncbi:hypothetical protein LV84_03415 [Algoriphagus ratkowskyi]|uniref:Uncharacterized protein n=1 Tax=Algoriphagus ratkowskyi TaxID=57028 RepID=A0A2W7RPV7_9BACT|nr:hypothetical protein LV84_03415 [Algoriphagus ratkowskyi]